VTEPRIKVLLDYALKVNADAKPVSNSDVQSLRDVRLTDLGVMQITHLVSDFASYNRLNLALDTDYDCRSFWQQLAFPAGG
tara:strand:- start:311 stop:553 length:243 start_codon:yes stop_codon:yes gene_type:complete